MKRDVPHASSFDPAERLRQNLRTAVDCLRSKESKGLVNHIVHDVAHLVSAFGERRLREQYDDLLGLTEDLQPTAGRERKAENVLERSQSIGSDPDVYVPNADYDGDTERIHEANRDLLDKLSTMRTVVRQLGIQREEEIQALTSELESCRRLLSETERRLINERIFNRKLRNQIDRLALNTSRFYYSPRQSSRSYSCHTTTSSEGDSGSFGFGALTVRGCRGGSHSQCRETTVSSSRQPYYRPISAKGRKHRREHDCHA